MGDGHARGLKEDVLGRDKEGPLLLATFVNKEHQNDLDFLDLLMEL